MTSHTKIEWTDRTWNPVSGCTKVSPGCAHCYAERIVNRFHGAGAFDQVLVKPHKLDEPLHWKKPARIFVNSMSDLFHDDVPDNFIAHVFSTMARCPQHTFQILTKRPSRMKQWFESGHIEYLGPNANMTRVQKLVGCGTTINWPLPNVWLGVSVENQHFADERIPILLDTPAAVRFVSYEPALGPVDFRPFLHGLSRVSNHGARITWLICGGESGPHARPMHPDWARAARDQCQAAGVPFFFKQWGEWMPVRIPWAHRECHRKHLYLWDDGLTNTAHQRWLDVPHDKDPRHRVVMCKVGKKVAGRLLGGREWNEFPGDHS